MRTSKSGITSCATMLGVTVLSSLTLLSCAVADTPTFDRGAEIREFVAQIEKNHLTRGSLDDQRAAQWFDRFLDDLDPHRMYFLESDYAGFLHFRTKIHDLARRGDTRFEDQVRRQYAKRVEEACSYATRFLSAEHDYSADEKFPRRYPAYASDQDQLCERWRLRIKAELLIEKTHGTALSDTRAWLSGRYRRIERQARDLTDEGLCEIYLNALAQVYDPHTAYLGPKVVMSADQTMTFSQYTLGLMIGQRRGQWVISHVRPALADRKTLQRLVGWELLAIQRLDGTMCDVVEMPRYDFDKLIRSPLGTLGCDTEVILEIQNPATLERRTLSWVRLITL